MSDYAPGDLVRVFYAKSWHRATVVHRGPAPGFAEGWPGVECRGDMLTLLVVPGSGLKTAGKPWDLIVAADSATVAPAIPAQRRAN